MKGASLQHPWVDARHAPLLRISFPEAATDDEVVAFCAMLEAFYASLDHPISWLVDCRRVRTVTASQRKLFAASETKVRREAGRYNMGGAFVIENAMIRGALTAIMWLAPSVYPHEVFGTLEAAEQWCRGKLAAGKR